MKLTRVYYPDELAPHSKIILSMGASHHLLRVLRIKIGSELVVFNGKGFEYFVRLVAVEKNGACLEILKKHNVIRESPLKLELGQGISRGERMDYVMQKAVELGVTEITPLFLTRCEVKLSGERLEKKLEHWRKIIISACEQSGRLIIPVLNQPQQMSCYLGQKKRGLKWICVPGGEKIIKRSLKMNHITLLVGPEGGFTEEEVVMAAANGYEKFSLGPRVLRTETAAVVALTVAQCYFGDISAD